MFKKVMGLMLVCVFFVAMILPLITADFQGGKVSIAENRYLASFPSFVKDNKIVVRAKDIDEWINDNVGGRRIATKLHTKLLYSIFGLSAKSDTLLGKNDWTFYYTEDILKDYSGDNLFTQEELANINKKLAVIKDYVEGHGSFFSFVIAPDKKTIYPENYPDGIKHESVNTRTAQLDEYLHNENNIDFYSLEPVLCESKGIGTLYSPRIDNAHWNSLGSYIGYTYMMQHLLEAGLDVSYIPLEQCTVTEDNTEGMFNEAIPLTEIAYTITNDRTEDFDLVPENLDRYPYLTFNNDPNTYKKYYVNKHSEYPSLLFIGDSYSQKLFNYVPQSFSRVMFLHSSDLPYLANVLKEEQFDIVIFESAERMLDYEFTLVDTCVNRIQQETENEVTWRQYEDLPVRDSDLTYQILDYVADTWTQGNTVFLKQNQDSSYAEGWAIDPLNGATAGMVLVQVGNRYYKADYGKERQSVVDAFGNEAYLNSGYTIILDTAEVMKAGEIAIHVISADGAYRYPPVVYRIDGATAKGEEAQTGLPTLDYSGDMGYQFLDLCGEQAVTGDAIFVDTENEACYIEGWAVDPVHGGTAGSVIVSVGEQDYTATYGKPRQGVADIYGSDDYLNCGYTAVLDTQTVLNAGQITIHVIASDGLSQYPPVTYRAERLTR